MSESQKILRGTKMEHWPEMGKRYQNDVLDFGLSGGLFVTFLNSRLKIIQKSSSLTLKSVCILGITISYRVAESREFLR